MTTTTSDAPNNVKGFYDRVLIKNAMPATLYDKWGQTRPMPGNKGDIINFRNWGKLAVNALPLNEGVTPSESKSSITDIYATLKSYGGYMLLTDWLINTGLDPNVTDICENLLSRQMAEMKDILSRDVLVAGTNIRYANGVSARASVVTALSDDDVDSTIRSLEGDDARKYTAQKAAATGFNTSPLGASYVAVSHTDSRKDIQALTDFVPVHEYASKDAISSQNGQIVEIGATPGIRWFGTTHGKIWADSGGSVGTTGLVSTSSSNIDVYGTLVFGMDAYGVVPLQKGSIDSIVKELGSEGSADPLNQRSSVGYKFASTTKILQQLWMIRLEHGVTDL